MDKGRVRFLICHIRLVNTYSLCLYVHRGGDRDMVNKSLVGNITSDSSKVSILFYTIEVVLWILVLLLFNI